MIAHPHHLLLAYSHYRLHGSVGGGGFSGLLHLIATAAIWSVVRRVIYSLPLPVAIVIGVAAAGLYLFVRRSSRRGTRRHSGYR